MCGVVTSKLASYMAINSKKNFALAIRNNS